MDYKTHERSRISGGESVPFFSTCLPLAGEFLKKEQIGTEGIYPLTLSFCPISSSIQVNEVVCEKKLFKNYFYKTGAIKTLVDHFYKTSDILKKRFSPVKILELGCNDFSFLKNFIGYSNLIIGIDPSDISLKNRPEGCVLENSFFNLNKSEEIKEKYGSFDLIFSSNNFAHIEDIKNYAMGIELLLNEEGVFVGEVHWVGSLIKNMQFSFIYHEHMYYHTLKAIIFLLKEVGLEVFDVERINTHGGSIRFFAKRGKEESERVKKFLEMESVLGLYDLQTYQNFSNDILALKESSKEFFKLAKENRKKVYGYGASGQANTLMSIFEISKEDMPIIIDDSPLKHGLYTPRNHILIENKDFLLKNPPDYIYLLAYTFEKEIRQKNKGINSEWMLPV